MAIITYSKATADWWKEHGYNTNVAFTTDEIDYWSIDVEDGDKELSNPEYIQIVMEEMQKYPEILRIRFAPVLYTVMVSQQIAMMPNKEGRMTLPLSRNLKLLRSVFTKPEKKQTPKYKELKRGTQIVDAMKRMATNGVHLISYFVDDTIIETFDIENIVNILDVKSVVLARADGSVASSDVEV